MNAEKKRVNIFWFTDGPCDSNKCSWGLWEHYKFLNCRPVYEDGACCPTRYVCRKNFLCSIDYVLQIIVNLLSLFFFKHNKLFAWPNLASLAAPAPAAQGPGCLYKGVQYAIGDPMPAVTDEDPCQAECLCTEDYGSRGSARVSVSSELV